MTDAIDEICGLVEIGARCCGASVSNLLISEADVDSGDLLNGRKLELSVQYLSTRGQAPTLDFEGVLLAGLARDGGLYLPEALPTFSAAELQVHARYVLPRPRHNGDRAFCGRQY